MTLKELAQVAGSRVVIRPCYGGKRLSCLIDGASCLLEGYGKTARAARRSYARNLRRNKVLIIDTGTALHRTNRQFYVPKTLTA